MKSKINVVLTETAVVVVANGTFMSSIPLRHWTTTEGMTWSGRLRRALEIGWLISRLRQEFELPSDDSVMKRLLRVMTEKTQTLKSKKAPTVRRIASTSGSRMLPLHLTRLWFALKSHAKRVMGVY